MCGCGRSAPTEVITSAQASADVQARMAEDAATQEAQRQISASNALANASTGWFVVEQQAEVAA
jgi:hypothetical protein